MFDGKARRRQHSSTMQQTCMVINMTSKDHDCLLAYATEKRHQVVHLNHVKCHGYSQVTGILLQEAQSTFSTTDTGKYAIFLPMSDFT